MTDAAEPGYGLAERLSAQPMDAPLLDYKPPRPRRYNPPIGVIGCGGISEQHLKAYRTMGLNIATLCSRTEASARRRRDEFYPEAKISIDWQEVLADPRIEVVDITIHPDVRAPIIEAALKAGKHVLSQKPFVTDLSVGQSLIDLAQANNRKLAVNLNGRWAPHFSYIRRALEQNLIGDALSVRMSIHWNHNWIAGSAFDELHHLVLSDFGIHWFDLMATFMAPATPKKVFASMTRTPSQRAKPPLMGQAVVEFDQGQGSVNFDGDVIIGERDFTMIAGTRGTIQSVGPSLEEQTVTLTTREGVATLALEGSWFTSGFQGAMGELLCAIEEDRAPYNSAESNMPGLSVCFAAVQSALIGAAVEVGSVTRLP